MIKEYKEWLFVEIIGQYSDFFVTRVQDGLYLCCPIPYGRVHWICSLPVERGAKVSIVGLAKDLTEAQWSNIVAGHIMAIHFEDHMEHEFLFKDYEDERQIVGADYNLSSASKSGLSLLNSLGFTPDQNILILKKL